MLQPSSFKMFANISLSRAGVSLYRAGRWIMPFRGASKDHVDRCGQTTVRDINVPNQPHVEATIHRPKACLLCKQPEMSACILFAVPLEQLGGKKRRQEQTPYATITSRFVAQLAGCLGLASGGYRSDQWLLLIIHGNGAFSCLSCRRHSPLGG